MQATTPAPRPHARWLITLLLPMAVLLGITGQLVGGFCYTLDDPYIHLQLADMLGRLGHYGLHPDSYASPSSSLLWTLWLTLWAKPLAFLPAAFDLVPLLTNLVILALLLNDLLAWLSRRFPPASVIWLALALTLTLNLYWLVMSGMEQLAQVWLTLRVAFALSENRWHQHRFFLALLALALLRYESLALVLPVLVWSAAHGQARRSLLTALAIAAALTGFAFYLHDGLGLNWLPDSILAKSVLFKVGHGYGQSLGEALSINIGRNLASEYPRNLILLALGAWLCPRQHRAAQRLLVLAAVVFVLHLVMARVQTGRYEMHVLALSWVAFLTAATPWLSGWMTQARRGLIGLFVVMLTLPSNVFSSLTAPWAAQNIHDQQGQLARFAQHYLQQRVAVNDLGRVVRGNPLPVLDLAGLGSPGAAERRRDAPHDSRWIVDLMREHDTHYAMVYDEWFPFWPASFQPVAVLNMPGMLLAPSSRRVAFYADSADTARHMLRAVRAWQADHPDQADWFWIARSQP